MITKRFLSPVAGVALATLVALAALFGNPGVAAAQTGPGTGAAGAMIVAGKIQAMQSNGFTLETRKGNVQVTTSDRTWFVVQKEGRRAEGSLADFAVGDKVTVAGTSSAAGQINARMVTQGALGKNHRPQSSKPKDQGDRHGKHPAQMDAIVKSIEGTTLVLTGPNGEREARVNTDAGTIFIKNGFASLADIRAGDRLTVMPRMIKPAERPAAGQPPAQRPVPTAAVVFVHAEAQRLTLGVVRSVDGNKLTVRGPKQEFMVNVDAATVYKKVAAPGQAPSGAALSDVTPGALVLVYGAPVAGQERVLAAKGIVIMPAPAKAP